MTRRDPDPVTRHDIAVILCRGMSRRMGQAKALACLPDDPKPLIYRVARIYDNLGWPVVAVTLFEQWAACCAAVAGMPSVTVLAADSGGDTALTVLAAWNHLAKQSPRPTHLWAHPVDLPHVALRSLRQLACVSAAHADRVVRPVWGSEPGHPVVLPVGVLRSMAHRNESAHLPLRNMLAAAAADGSIVAPCRVEVADPGVILDYDTMPASSGAQEQEMP